MEIQSVLSWEIQTCSCKNQVKRPVKSVRINECENTFQRNSFVKLTLASPTIAARKFRVITENKETAKMYFSIFDMLSILWNKSCLQLKETHHRSISTTLFSCH